MDEFKINIEAYLSKNGAFNAVEKTDVKMN